MKVKKLFFKTFLFVAFVVPLSASANQINDPNLILENIQDKKKISGTVLDENGNSVIGASVRVLGNSSIGAITDVDGHFSLNIPIGTTIQISFLGYVPVSIKVGDQNVYNVVLKEDVAEGGEVVISAFGTGQKKESVVGAVQMIKPSDLKVPAANLSSSFAGRLAGVISFSRSGQPGANGANFYIRGISTISGVTNPLIVLDGVEISASDLNALDPDIIEGFSILKDATATAMYGTRGANGVMIVKTKSGLDVEKPIIGLRMEAYVTQPTKMVKFVDGPTYMGLYNEAVTSQGTGDVLFTNEQILNTRNGVNPYLYPNVDWYNEMFNNLAMSEKINFNIRGGTKKITYFMNVNFNNEGSMLKNRAKDFFSYSNGLNVKRYAFQNNIDFHLTNTSTISLHLNVQLQDSSSPNSDLGSVYNSIMNSNPVDFPVYFPGNDTPWVKWGAYSGGNDQGASNPMAMFTNGYRSIFESTVIANLDFDQKLDFITEGLRFKALFSYKNFANTNTYRVQGYNRYTVDSYSKNEDGTYDYNVSSIGTPTKPTLSTGSSNKGDKRIYAQAYLDYMRGFGVHNISAMVLGNIDEYSNNVPGSDLVSSLSKRKMGFAGRIAYDYDNRYLIEFNAGYNGSENFAKGHRWGFFPSAAIGWNLSLEDFWEPIRSKISNLKLRASYGKVGNDQYGEERFIYLSDISLTGSPYFQTGFGGVYNNLSGPTYNRFENKDITWEVGKKLNIGIDMQLFNSLSITAELFQETRSNIFQQKYSIPNYLGTSETKIYGNLAKVKNWGFEFSADYAKQVNNDLVVMFKGTFTFARNKVLEYDEAPGLRPELSMIGKRLNMNTGYISNGLYIDYNDIINNPTSTLGNIAIAPGDIKYVDQPDADGNYDGKITSEDKVYLGDPTIPEIVYGFGPSFQYKKWDFSFFFQGVANTSLMMSGFHPFGTQYNRNVLTFIAEDHWSPSNQNPNAAYPRLTKYDNNHNSVASDYWLRSGAFIRLKNIDLGYSFSKFRVYASGMNLLLFSPFKYWDPEQGGGRGLSYPPQRTFSIGIQMTFK